MSDDVKACFIICAALVGLSAVIGHFASSCEASRNAALTECLRAGRSAVECSVLDRQK